MKMLNTIAAMKKTSVMNPLMLIVLFIICAPWGKLYATSTCNTAGGNIAIAAGAMVPPQNAQTGITISTVASTMNIQCKNDTSGLVSFTNIVKVQPNGSLVSGYNNVFQTNIAGLGVRYIVTYTQCGYNNVVITGTTGLSMTGCRWTDLPYSPYSPRPMNITTEFVMTGPISTGSILTSIPPLQLWITGSDSGGPWLQAPPLSGTASGSVVPQTCTISQRDLFVALPEVTVRDFSAGNRATAGDTDTSIDLICPEGLKVALTLTDATTPANTSDILSLTADSTVKGIAIQMLNNTGLPIFYGPDSDAAGNTNQWLAGTSAAGAMHIPLTVRYIRTGDMQGGSLKAIATYTMSYQ